jgi:hypothetical protein
LSCSTRLSVSSWTGGVESLIGRRIAPRTGMCARSSSPRHPSCRFMALSLVAVRPPRGMRYLRVCGMWPWRWTSLRSNWHAWDLPTSMLETGSMNVTHQYLRARTLHSTAGKRVDAIDICVVSLTCSAGADICRLRVCIGLSPVLPASRSSAPASRTTLKGTAQQMVQRFVPELAERLKTASLRCNMYLDLNTGYIPC